MTLEALMEIANELRRQRAQVPERAYMDEESRRVILAHLKPVKPDSVPAQMLGLKVFAAEVHGWRGMAQEVMQGTALCYLNGQLVERENAWATLEAWWRAQKGETV